MIDAWLSRSERIAGSLVREVSISAWLAFQQEVGERRIGDEEGGEVALELYVRGELAADEADGRRSDPVALEPRRRGGDHRRVVGESEVVVRAQAQQLTVTSTSTIGPCGEERTSIRFSVPASRISSSSQRRSASSVVIFIRVPRSRRRLRLRRSRATSWRGRRHHQRWLQVERGRARVGDHPLRHASPRRRPEARAHVPSSPVRGRTRSPESSPPPGRRRRTRTDRGSRESLGADALQLAHVLEHRLALERVDRGERRGAGGRQPRPRAARRHVVIAAHRPLDPSTAPIGITPPPIALPRHIRSGCSLQRSLANRCPERPTRSSPRRGTGASHARRTAR